MKKILFVIIVFCLGFSSLQAQKFFTKNGTIGFDATSPSSPERIEGKNRSATCVLDIQSGVIQFAVLMKGFAFERALMEEHFNENYVESNKFPRAEFRGKVKDIGQVDLGKDGTYSVKVKGDLTMHGKTKEVETTGKLTVKGGKVSANGAFTIKLSDFDISIPGLVADKVSKTASISVDCALEPLKN